MANCKNTSWGLGHFQTHPLYYQLKILSMHDIVIDQIDPSFQLLSIWVFEIHFLNKIKIS